jgi:autoinducer 2-degrading protein
MIVRIIDVYVREQNLEAFRDATLKNRDGSIREPGVLRFDVLQDEAEPAHFVLFEVYRDEKATLDHKETDHYQIWRQAVELMMARPRSATACSVVAPLNPHEWRP